MAGGDWVNFERLEDFGGTRSVSRGTSVVRIRGRLYDKILIDVARKAHVNTDAKELTIADVVKMLEHISPATDYTAFQKATINYIRRKFKWSREAEQIRDNARRKRMVTLLNKKLDSQYQYNH